MWEFVTIVSVASRSGALRRRSHTCLEAVAGDERVVRVGMVPSCGDWPGGRVGGNQPWSTDRQEAIHISMRVRLVGVRVVLWRQPA